MNFLFPKDLVPEKLEEPAPPDFVVFIEFFTCHFAVLVGSILFDYRFGLYLRLYSSFIPQLYNGVSIQSCLVSFLYCSNKFDQGYKALDRLLICPAYKG